MALSFSSRLKNAWNVFNNKDVKSEDYGVSSSYRPYRSYGSKAYDKSIVTSVINRIAMDAAAIDIKHVRLDENDRFIEVIKDGLNNCFQLEANIDQPSRVFVQDIVFSMLDEGCVAVVPIDTNVNPNRTDSYDILTMRVGKIVQWYPRHVTVEVYNDRTGNREQVNVRKESVAIIENPFYAIMNEPNSSMKRLSRKINLLDSVDEQSSYGKLDMIIQLPYIIKTEAKRKQADDRRKEIERQLSGSKYGIAYTDGTERITQLNRPLENNLLSQVEYLTKEVYGQLGFTQEILNGTANEETMLNYYNRSIEPILSAIVLELKRKFITKTARTQGQSVEFYRDPFKLVPVGKIAEIADKFTRNEILSSNEIRQIIGAKPSSDPNADELRNKNLNNPQGMGEPPYYEEDPNVDPNADPNYNPYEEPYPEESYENQNDSY